MMSPGIELGISRTEGHELTNYCLLQPKFFFILVPRFGTPYRNFFYTSLYLSFWTDDLTINHIWLYGHCTNLPLKTVTYRPFPLSGQQIFKFSGTKNAYATKLFNSHRPSLKYQHGHHFIVLRHKYGGRQVMWKHCINLVLLPTLLFYPADQCTDESRLLEMCQEWLTLESVPENDSF